MFVPPPLAVHRSPYPAPWEFVSSAMSIHNGWSRPSLAIQVKVAQVPSAERMHTENDLPMEKEGRQK